MNRPNQDMQQKRMNQKELYEWIMMLGFCAVDMMLYLDTHPDDEEALNYFNQCTALYNAAKQSYQEQFGQLNAFSEQERSSWDWNTAPMPWNICHRKGECNLCGVMKNDYSIRFILRHRMRRWRLILSASMAVLMVN